MAGLTNVMLREAKSGRVSVWSNGKLVRRFDTMGEAIAYVRANAMRGWITRHSDGSRSHMIRKIVQGV